MMEKSNALQSTSHTDSRNVEDTMGWVLVSLKVAVTFCSIIKDEWIACCLQLIYVVVIVQNAKSSVFYLIRKREERLYFIGYWFDVFNATHLQALLLRLNDPTFQLIFKKHLFQLFD